MNKDKTGIKPCPFCGQIPDFTKSWDEEDLYYLACDNINCAVEVKTVLSDTTIEAIYRWNDRKGESNREENKKASE